MLRIAVVALLALAACGGQAGGGPDPRGAWELVSDDGTATLVLEDGQLSGRSFCNSYSGSYRLDDDALSVAGLGGTEMGCEPQVMAAETAFLSALAAADRVSLDGEELVLTGADVTLRFREQPPVEDRALAGTRWVLDTLVDGEVASSVLGEGTLRLADDGTASGSTGCRPFLGTWQVSGDALSLVLTRDDVGCPADLGRQDEHVLAVLDAGPRATVDGERLTLTAPDGRGLSYRAG